MLSMAMTMSMLLIELVLLLVLVLVMRAHVIDRRGVRGREMGRARMRFRVDISAAAARYSMCCTVAGKLDM